MINRISIKNFKSLNVDVQLDPVTVLVGRSGTGKSNFVEAMRFLRKVLTNGVSSEDRKFLPFVRTEDEIDYKIDFIVPPLNKTLTYNIGVGNLQGAFRIVKESFFVANETVFHYSSGKWFTEPKVHDIPKIQPNLSILSTLNGIQQVSIAHIALTRGIGCYDFPGSVCTTSKLNPNDPGNLIDTGENFFGVFESIRNDLNRLVSWETINKLLGTLNSTFGTVDIKIQNGKNNVVVAHKFGGKTLTFDISQESEGFRRFFAHLLALYQYPSKQTLLFEEPERGIHPGAMETLAEALKRCPEEGRGQVILTTHSPELLDHFEPESIRAVEIHDGETRIGRISKEQLEAVREFLYRPGQLLTDEDARIDETEYSLSTGTEF